MAFTAVVSIGVIGLYIAYVIPIWLRWRLGDKFEPGPWTLGKKYKWMCLVSVIEVIVVVVIGFNLPFSSSGVPWESDFEWSLFNYTPGGHRRPVRDRRDLVAGQRAPHVQGSADARSRNWTAKSRSRGR